MVALGLIALLLVAFASERYPPEVVAISGMAVFLILGLVDSKDMLGALSNSAPWTIIAMFIVTASLTRTGTLETIGLQLQRLNHFGVWGVLLGFIAVNIVLSALFNNIPQVVMMIPVTIVLAHACNMAPSRLLMPLSYATILGGTLTLLGASTNLVVDGVVQAAGLPRFTIFEITPVGIVVALAGGIYLVFAARYLIPDRTTVTDSLGVRARSQFLVEALIPHDSPLIGQHPQAVALFRGSDRRVVDVVRGDVSLRRDMTGVQLAAGDIVVLKSAVANVLTLRDVKGIDVGAATGSSRETRAGETDIIEPVATRTNVFAEALVGPQSRLIGRTLRGERFRRRYGVYPIALHRHNVNLDDRLDDIPLEVADTLLLEGAPEDLDRLAKDAGLINLSRPQERALRLRKAPIALLILAAVIGISAIDVVPIVTVAWIGVAAVLLTRCIDPEEAFEAVEWRVVILLWVMLIIGRGLEKSGAVDSVVNALLPFLKSWHPVLVLACVYFLASALTEVITANAVAIIMTPLAMSLAQTLGLDPRGFAVAVMFAASASFATPIGYQTNTLVYSAGGYKFSDFVRIGLPLNIIAGVVSVIAISWMWPQR